MFDKEPGDETRSLPEDVLVHIFGLLSPHERRFTIPMVCKNWCQAVLPGPGKCALWKFVEVRDDCNPRGPSPSRSSTGISKLLQHQSLCVCKWLWDRRQSVAVMDIHLTSYGHSSTPRSLASWAHAFGDALPVLTNSPTLKQLVIYGPGAGATATGGLPSACHILPNTATESAGVVLCSALTLPRLDTLRLYGIPWAASLYYAVVPPGSPSRHHLQLSHLRDLTINSCFYSSTGTGTDPHQDDDPLAKAAVEAWEALGRVLAALPLLEHLDLGFTHAMTYVDPARGAVPSPWPALVRLRELSLAHDLSVQPPPPPPPLPSLPPPSMPNGPQLQEIQGSLTPITSVQGFQGEASHPAAAGGPSSSSGTPTAAAAAMTGASTSTGDSRLPSPPESGHLGRENEASWARMSAALSEAEAAWHGSASGAADEAADSAEMSYDSAASVGALLEQPLLLTIDAALAAVELLSWLPSCTSLTSLDLRACGLEAVPMAVAHLPALARLDLYGNPLGGMRLPGPLRSLTWLRFSLDPCYDVLYDMAAADAGDAVAAAEMYGVDLLMPVLQELEVDATSSRALGAIRQAATALPALRSLVLTDLSDMALA